MDIPFPCVLNFRSFFFSLQIICCLLQGELIEIPTLTVSFKELFELIEWVEKIELRECNLLNSDFYFIIYLNYWYQLNLILRLLFMKCLFFVCLSQTQKTTTHTRDLYFYFEYYYKKEEYFPSQSFYCFTILLIKVKTNY